MTGELAPERRRPRLGSIQARAAPSATLAASHWPAPRAAPVAVPPISAAVTPSTGPPSARPMSRGMCLVPATTARYYARPGLVYLPITDADSVPIALAWHAAADQPLLRLVVDTARAVAAELLTDAGQEDWLPPDNA